MYHLSHAHEQLKIGSVIDDRNFRGPTEVVLNAAKDAVQFDLLAGLRNNFDKYVAIGNSSASRK